MEEATGLIKIDPQNLTPEVEDLLVNYLYDLLDKMYDRDYYDCNMFRLNCALKQKTISQSYGDGDAALYGVSKEYLQSLENVDYEVASQADEFSALTTPIMLKAFRALRANVANIVFPLAGGSTGVTRTYAEFFDSNSINDFLPAADECWTSIIEGEDRNYQFKSIYESILDEGLAHGVFAMDHEYDDLLEVIEPVAPGIKSVGIYPLQSDWRKSNRCFYVDVNYNQLLGRSDFRPGIIESIRPRVTDSDFTSTDGASPHKNGGGVPFGKVRCVKFYCPSVYIEDGETVYYAEGLFVVALINPDFRETTHDLKSLYILKIETEVPIDRHGLLLGTPVVNQPNEFFNQGIFYPWLSHHKVANGFYSACIRLASYLTKGPFNEERSGFSSLDSKNEELENGFHAYQVLRGKKYTPVFSAEFINFIQTGYNTISRLETDILAGIGIDKPALGIVNTGNNLKDEVLKAAGSGDLRVLEYAVRYSELRVASIFTKIRSYGHILRQQVLTKLQEVKDLLIAQGVPVELTPDDVSLIEAILEENKLFKRLLNMSGLKQRYREFYKKRQKEILDNENIVRELAISEREVMQAKQFALSPINWMMYPPAPVGQQVDPETGKITPITLTPEQEMMRRQAWEADQMQQRQRADDEANKRILDIRKKEISLKPIEAIPELNNLLLFNILVAPIEESNIEIPGVKQAILKSVRDGDLAAIGNILGSMPPDELAKVDFHKLFGLATRGNSITRDMIMKDEATITREEELRNQKEEYQQQVMMEMSKTPGAQPPQIGKGNSA